MYTEHSAVQKLQDLSDVDSFCAPKKIVPHKGLPVAVGYMRKQVRKVCYVLSGSLCWTLVGVNKFKLTHPDWLQKGCSGSK